MMSFGDWLFITFLWTSVEAHTQEHLGTAVLRVQVGQPDTAAKVRSSYQSFPPESVTNENT